MKTRNRNNVEFKVEDIKTIVFYDPPPVMKSGRHEPLNTDGPSLLDVSLSDFWLKEQNNNNNNK